MYNYLPRLSVIFLNNLGESCVFWKATGTAKQISNFTIGEHGNLCELKFTDCLFTTIQK